MGTLGREFRPGPPYRDGGACRLVDRLLPALLRFARLTVVLFSASLPVWDGSDPKDRVGPDRRGTSGGIGAGCATAVPGLESFGCSRGDYASDTGACD